MGGDSEGVSGHEQRAGKEQRCLRTGRGGLEDPGRPRARPWNIDRHPPPQPVSPYSYCV